MYSPVSLSPREKEVLRLLCRELSSKEIGKQLGLSRNTISIYRLHLRNKLNMTTIGMIKYAVKEGIVEP